MPGRGRRHPLGPEATVGLNPPNPVCRNVEPIFVLEVHRRQHTGSNGRQSEHNGQNPGLGGVFHETGQYLSTLVTKSITIVDALITGHAVSNSTENHNLFRNSHYK